MIILGLDIALRTTGYGVIETSGKSMSAVDCGVIQTSKSKPLSECLRRLAGGVKELVSDFRPDVAAIEGGFFSRNAKTAMVLGMARGAVVCMLAGEEITSYEYAPRRARQTVVGHGGADKEQVAVFLARLLSLDRTEIPNDATDALAIAVCHHFTAESAGGLYLGKPI